MTSRRKKRLAGKKRERRRRGIGEARRESEEQSGDPAADGPVIGGPANDVIIDSRPRNRTAGGRVPQCRSPWQRTYGDSHRRDGGGRGGGGRGGGGRFFSSGQPISERIFGLVSAT